MIKPMLAKNYLDFVDRINPLTQVIYQPKFDGIRAITYQGKFYTRNGKELYLPHIFISKDVTFDGEVIVPGEDFNGISSIVKRPTNPHPRIEEAVYVVFDDWDRNLFPRPAQESDIAFNTKAGWENNIESEIVFTPQLQREFCEATYILNDMTSAGWEGIMIRIPKTPYMQGKRSKNLLKYKKWLFEDCLVIGQQPGKGKHKGMMGALTCITEAGAIFHVGSGFSDTQRMSFVRNQPERITVKYQELSSKGIPRFPIFIGEVKIFNKNGG